MGQIKIDLFYMKIEESSQLDPIFIERLKQILEMFC